MQKQYCAFINRNSQPRCYNLQLHSMCLWISLTIMNLDLKNKPRSCTAQTWLESFFSFTIKYSVARRRHIPWPQSPNITANRKGNVITVYTPGFASWYLATLQLQNIILGEYFYEKNNKHLRCQIINQSVK